MVFFTINSRFTSFLCLTLFNASDEGKRGEDEKITHKAIKASDCSWMAAAALYLVDKLGPRCL